MDYWKLISAFIKDQQYVVELLQTHYAVKKNITSMEWVSLYAALKKQYEAHPIAMVFKIHGHGLEFKDDRACIDFDFSDSGRPDGFDSWRLLYYAELNQIQFDGCTFGQLNAWLQSQCRFGNLDQEVRLYFLPLPHQQVNC
ncbi:MAG: hypothetical protein KIS92_15945 [Planctomycetota bacterium]|nr:hypothetical protein [Planctomycetota bacterium]